MPNPRSNGVIPFTRVGFVSPFVAYLERAGVPTERYLCRAKIPPDLLRNEEGAVPLRLAYRFLQEACRAEGVEDAGLRVGRETALEHLGAFGQLLLGSRNILDYLETGARLINIVQPVDQYDLWQEGVWVRFSHRQEGPGISETEKQHSYLFALTITVNTIRQAAGFDWCPPEIRLPVLNPGAQEELQRLFPNTRVILGSRNASFLFPASFLALPMPKTAGLDSVTEEHSRTTSLPADFLGSVRLLVESMISYAYPDIATVAEAAGLSVRTLRRRLAAYGTNYSDLVAKTRITLAEQWLAQTDRPVSEIARTLGYTDRSNFTRAFRRLNGISPQAYRDVVIRPEGG